MSSKMSTGTILVSVLAFSRCCSAADVTIDFAALFGFTDGSGTDPAERTFDFASIGISPHLRQVAFKRINRGEDNRTHHMLNFRILARFDFVIGPAFFGFLAIGLPLRRAARSYVPATTAAHHRLSGSSDGGWQSAATWIQRCALDESTVNRLHG